MRITTLFSLKAIALDSTASTQEEILNELVELQATHDNIMDKAAYKKALYAREAEGSTYVDNGITVPHAKSDVVLHPSLAVLRLKEPVQYNPDDDGKTDLLFAIAAPQNGSLHVDMLARMMQMLMNEDFVEKLRTAKTPKEFLDCIDQQEQDQFGDESFTSQPIPPERFPGAGRDRLPQRHRPYLHGRRGAGQGGGQAGTARQGRDQRLRRREERADQGRDRRL